ncbi:MAG: orotidine-5'-phosphate decarboxylase [Alphaproteobacteria bacterium]|nr:orotidine-5'-phosphate decarboxylase [Alphaproteobacteria bacterium]PPR14772.1 MAG: Orotidine 5'-phosphate decarboxylase [Alphaproteobacteria bacterium MarineAlpha12_Bin1]
MKYKNPIFVALDTSDLDQALAWAIAVRSLVGGVKVGLEFFSSNGAEGLKRIIDLGVPVFLDLKFHDIPNTVHRAVGEVVDLGVSIINVHASGGKAMMEAAVKSSKDKRHDPPLMAAVTVLTSLDENDLVMVGQATPVVGQVERLALLAKTCGLDGVVCSPNEISHLRKVCGDDFLLIVPGIRPRWSSSGDQKRVMTPKEAYSLGADILVIGRPITGAENPTSAVERIVEELNTI